MIFLRRKKPEPTPETVKTKEVREQYADYCEFEDVTREELYEQFDQLCSLPDVSFVAFEKATGACMIGTRHIYLQNEQSGRMHDIGEFIITMDRSGKSIKFENITRVVSRTVDGGTVSYHPHIPAETGAICMPGGGSEMYVMLAEGNILRAMKIALAGLNTYTRSGNPYSELNRWPEKEQGDDT